MKNTEHFKPVLFKYQHHRTKKEFKARVKVKKINKPL